MNDFSAYVVFQHLTRRYSHSALPEASVDDDWEAKRSDGGLVSFRRRLSADLRRLADRLEPAPHRPSTSTTLLTNR
jgi:hypothetical protein